MLPAPPAKQIVPLRRSEELLRASLDNLPQGICMYDGDRNLIAWNYALTLLLDIAPDSLRCLPTHQHLLSYCRAKNLPIDAIDWDFLPEVPLPRRLEVGPDHALEVRRFRLEDGGLMITFGDHEAARLRATATLQAANETLERRVCERTSALTSLNHQLQQHMAELVATEEALLEAKTAAEQANLSKTRFLAAASHDLLQPLNAARLFISAMNNQKLPARTHKLTQQSLSALDSVEDLLEALLEISKLDSSDGNVDIRDFPISELLTNMLEEFSPQAKLKGLNFQVDTRQQWVRSDRRLLRRILQNLVSNAIKYTASGSVTVSLRITEREVVVEVADTGSGIALESQMEIFEEFKRLECDSASVGVGLGLAIVQRASNLLGHLLSLESELGVGSKFSISVPAGRPVTCERPPEEPGDAAQAVEFSKLTALVLDNDKSILDGMSALLGAWGCQVLLAPNEASAAEILRRRNGDIDLIIADYHLDQGQKGDEAVASLRRQFGQDLRGFILTADRSLDTQNSLRRQGLRSLNKPVRPARLRALINQVLRDTTAPPGASFRPELDHICTL